MPAEIAARMGRRGQYFFENRESERWRRAGADGVAAVVAAPVSLYTGDTALRWTYVLGALFATFWWNYLRAHAAEIYQTLFFIAFFFHLVRHLRGCVLTPDGGARRRFPWHLLAASAYLAALFAVPASVRSDERASQK